MLAVPVVSVASGACWTGIVEARWVQNVKLTTTMATVGKEQSQSAIQREKMVSEVSLWREERYTHEQQSGHLR